MSDSDPKLHFTTRVRRQYIFPQDLRSMRLDLPSLIPGVFDSTIKGRVKTQAERDSNARSDELAAHVGSLNDVLHAKINEEMSKLLDENHKKALEAIKNIKP